MDSKKHKINITNLLLRLKKEQKKNNLEYIDLYDCIFEHDVEHMVEVLREMGEKKFLISVKQTNVADIIAMFEKQGFKLIGVVEVTDCYGHYEYDENGNSKLSTKNAFLMEVR